MNVYTYRLDTDTPSNFGGGLLVIAANRWQYADVLAKRRETRSETWGRLQTPLKWKRYKKLRGVQDTRMMPAVIVESLYLRP